MVLVLSFPCTSARAKTWTASGAEAFAAGELEGVSVLSTGEVVLAPETEEIEGLEAEFVWDVEAASGGAVYVGTGSPGAIYVLEGDRLELLHSVATKHVLSVLPLQDGSVLAATAPGGAILRIDRRGEVSTFAEVPDSYVWDMAFGPAHGIYCATGPEGRLLEFNRVGESKELAKVEQKHLMCVAVDPEGNVYAGTAPEGYVYRVDRKGSATIVYDAAEGEVHDLVLDQQGVLYACTAEGGRQSGSVPSPPQPGSPNEAPTPPPAPETPIQGAPGAHNSVYRIDPREGATVVARFDKVFVLSLALFDDQVLAGTGPGGRLMGIKADETQCVLNEFDSAHLTAIAAEPGGDAIIGMSNAGALWRLRSGPRTTGELVSKPFDAGYLSRWGRIWWEAAVETGQNVRLKLRTGNAAEPDEHWSDWSRWATESSGDEVDAPIGRFAQFGAELSTHARMGSPRLWEVNVSFRQANRKPRIEDLKIDGVSMLRKEDNGDAGGRGRPRPARRRGQGNGQPAVRAIEWKATDPNEDDLAYDLHYRAMDEKEWKPLEEDIREEPAYKWDTTRVPDGRYMLKLVARDDLARSVEDALRDERITPPFTVDNRPPAVVDLDAEPRGDGSYLITGVARDEGSRIAELNVSRNSGDWEAAFPSDGIFDSLQEAFAFPTDVLEAGEHVFVVAATDETQNTGSAKIVITVEPER
jgi:hypothetical protein